VRNGSGFGPIKEVNEYGDGAVGSIKAEYLLTNWTTAISSIKILHHRVTYFYSTFVSETSKQHQNHLDGPFSCFVYSSVYLFIYDLVNAAASSLARITSNDRINEQGIGKDVGGSDRGLMKHLPGFNWFDERSTR
jgi:hypothetical protein